MIGIPSPQRVSKTSWHGSAAQKAQQCSSLYTGWPLVDGTCAPEAAAFDHADERDYRGITGSHSLFATPPYTPSSTPPQRSAGGNGVGCQRKAPSPHASIPSGILLLNREIRASPDHGLVYSNVAIELAPGSDSSLIENDEAGAGLFDDDMEDDDMVSYMFATQRAASDPDLGARALVVGAIARPCGPNAETLLRSMAEPDVRLELEERMLGMEVSEMLQRRTLDVEFTNTPPPSCPRPSRVYRPGHLGLQVTPEQDVLHEEINAVREAPYYREWDR